LATGESVPDPPPTPRAARPARPRVRSRLPATRLRRAIYALVFLAIVLTGGTVGFHLLAGLNWVDAFYFESMLATGQGPPFLLTSVASKLYASGMAFLSVGSVLTTIVFTLGPILARLWHEAAERFEQDARRLEAELRSGPRQP
jgi:hypothetical protein